MINKPRTFRQRTMSLLIPVRILDALAIVIAGLLSYWFYSVRYNVDFIPMQSAYVWLIIGGSVCSMIALSIAGPPVFSRGVQVLSLLRQVIVGVMFLFVIIVGVLFATKQSEVYSRWWSFIWCCSSIVCLFSERMLVIWLLSILRKRGINQKSVVIVGAGRLGQSLATNVNAAAWPSFQIIAFFDQRRRNVNSEQNDIPVENDLDLLIDYIENKGIHEVWIALPLKAEQLIETLVNDLLETTVTVRFLPDTFSLRLFRHHITEIYGFPMLDLSAPKITGIDKVLKASLDYAFATTALLVLSPLLLCIAVAVKLSSKGPVLFKQKRVGWDGKLFKVYKFRTMYVHTEEKGTVTQASQDDARVTSIGKWLRRTSCDELPQFFNVLQGRMSVVGPRPHVPEFNDSYRSQVKHYMRRHKVKPGITGLAQVKGWRGETDTAHKIRKRVQYDLFYLENWSIGFDVKIIFLTMFRGFVHQNAV